MQLRKIVIVLLIGFNVNLFAQSKQRLDLNIEYPAPSNSYIGILSANLQYNWQFKIEGNYFALGGSATLLNNKQGKWIMNHNLDIGFNRFVDLTPTMVLYPYWNIGYARFKYESTSSNGVKVEIGVSSCNSNLKHWLGFRIGYRQYLVEDFYFKQKTEKAKGLFGVFLIGVHFHLNRRR